MSDTDRKLASNFALSSNNPAIGNIAFSALCFAVFLANSHSTIVRVRGMGVDDEVVAAAAVFPHELCTYNR